MNGYLDSDNHRGGCLFVLLLLAMVVVPLALGLVAVWNVAR